MTRTDLIEIHYDLKFRTPFHMGSGLRVGLIDRTVVRDRDNNLYVPGSSLKGCVREHCERLERLYTEEASSQASQHIVSPHDTEKALWLIGHPLSMVTRIFGSSYYPGHLHFEDARLAEDEKISQQEDEHEKPVLQTFLYTQARLDRPTRTAVPGALYSSEFGLREITFKGSVTGWLECIPIEELETETGKITPTYSLLLLLAGLHMVERLGGNKSVGKGECGLEISQVSIKNEKKEKEEWMGWLDNLSLLSYYALYAEEEIG
ncbi:hypothetical protein EPA93_22850 [Ktedonosporobacter rubrisoli]|uniref:CRISPR type III-associated protein domain-containing protein n=1 Tax=Ktedonosporobacter rubrisoli TaxID=2509675 RepID=A0A4P6JTN8_KTERU|nr:RAMP superfamily CRISPR-associated protein [Ktedonosporobacter rubrisoli]QBD78670.1 hypothetical protein EPA93_22850 [Ktedonosporobacter rubrisoli]